MFQSAPGSRFVRVGDGYEPGRSDTTRTILSFDSKIHFEFHLTGFDRIDLPPGLTRLEAGGIKPGWRFADILGANMWVRGLPFFVSGADKISVDVSDDYVRVDGRVYFVATTTQSTQYPYDPTISFRCNDCTIKPTIIIDGTRSDYTVPLITVKSGWHSIEIEDSHDNIDVYYGRTFISYSVTEISVYPVEMN
jgi:hypothetical protein